MKEQLSQLVQDVLDGEESAIKANDQINEIIKHCKTAKKEIDYLLWEELDDQENASNKDNNKPGTF